MPEMLPRGVPCLMPREPLSPDYRPFLPVEREPFMARAGWISFAVIVVVVAAVLGLSVYFGGRHA
jgi:hypothetical protein